MKKNPIIYINLIISNLTKSTDFYKALGFEQNMDYSNQEASAMMWKTDFAVMLLTKPFAQGFLPEHKSIAPKNTSSALYALELSSKEEVNNFMKLALAAGGEETKQYDHGFMYGRDFEDPDGNIWEVFWMDSAGIPKE